MNNISIKSSPIEDNGHIKDMGDPYSYEGQWAPSVVVHDLEVYISM